MAALKFACQSFDVWRYHCFSSVVQQTIMRNSGNGEIRKYDRIISALTPNNFDISPFRTYYIYRLAWCSHAVTVRYDTECLFAIYDLD